MPYHLTAPFTDENKRALSNKERKALIEHIKSLGFEPHATFATEADAKAEIARIKAAVGVTMQFTFEGKTK